jgi:hypothetical protein
VPRNRPASMTPTPKPRPENRHLRRVIDFLNEIGLPCSVSPGVKGFLPGVRIELGTLLVDPNAFPGDVLHEAGHLATMPGRFRRQASDNIDTVLRLMLDTVDFSNPDVGEARAAIQCGDPEATAWAWAAGEHIGLVPGQIIALSHYGGTGGEIREMLRARAYVGIHGLSSAAFCVTRPGAMEKIRGLPAYPKLAMWLQQDFDPQSRDANDDAAAEGTFKSLD